MTFDYSQAEIDEFQRLNSEVANINLLNVVLSTDAGATVRVALVNDRTDVTHASVTYYRANFTRPGFSLNDKGRIDTFEISIGTTDALVATMIRRLKGLHDAPIRVRWVTAADLTGSNPGKFVDAFIVNTIEVFSHATFTIGRPDLYEVPLPRDVYNQDGCPRELGGPGCRFPFPAPGQIGYGDPNVMRCTRRYHGPGGCVAHGDNEVARMSVGQLPVGARLHPGNFGAQRALPVQR